jgi:hypothetical protein
MNDGITTDNLANVYVAIHYKNDTITPNTLHNSSILTNEFSLVNPLALLT